MDSSMFDNALKILNGINVTNTGSSSNQYNSMAGEFSASLLAQ
jgi:hypothetical protein